MADRDEAVRAAAERHGLSRDAVAALWEALRRGGGRMAQFSHPDLGGMGQWSGGGMVQIGDMFNDRLKARVAAACVDLSEALGSVARARPRDPASPPREDEQEEEWVPAGSAPWQRQGTPAETAPRPAGSDWWPAGLGHPSASGAQNGLRYAYFAGARRLAIERDGRVTLYDTGRHRIFGVSQRQSRGSDLAFTAEDGTVDLDGLAVVNFE